MQRNCKGITVSTEIRNTISVLFHTQWYMDVYDGMFTGFHICCGFSKRKLQIPYIFSCLGWPNNWSNLTAWLKWPQKGEMGGDRGAHQTAHVCLKGWWVPVGILSRWGERVKPYEFWKFLNPPFWNNHFTKCIRGPPCGRFNWLISWNVLCKPDPKTIFFWGGEA